jgi:hypothetical protein
LLPTQEQCHMVVSRCAPITDHGKYGFG